MKKDRIACFNWKLTQYKHLEIQISYWKNWTDYFTFNCNWSRKVDHAGFRVLEGFFGYEFSLTICDNRKWNKKEDSWYVNEKD